MLALVALVAPGFAQSFLDPLPVPMGPNGIAVLTDGTEVEGQPRIWVRGPGNIKKIRLKLEDGTKVKLAPSQVSEFRLVPASASKRIGTSHAMSSIIELVKTSPGDAMARREALFLPGTLPNGKPALLQLLNPSFDDTLHVFAAPDDGETEAILSYLVLERGQSQTVLVTKGAYESLWDTLYGDCAAMPRPRIPTFAHMASDVKRHAVTCGRAGTAAPSP